LRLNLPDDCESVLQSYDNRSQQNQKLGLESVPGPRGIALGALGSWIIYDNEKHTWGGEFLPEVLIQALELGQRESWTIKVCKMSLVDLYYF
jgi:hypothetical protein